MRAIVLDRFGEAALLRPLDLPRPQPSEGEILVRVKAAGINPIDCKTRIGQGVARMIKGEPFPLVLGWDVAGVVEESRSAAFKPGDEVYAMARFPQIAGGYAELIAAPAGDFALKPKNVDFNAAAAVPLAALTAWQALFDKAQLAAGQTALIHAAAGGVGHFAVQLAKAKGARVIGTASAGKVDFVKALGADQVIDYAAQDFSMVAKDVDVVFHMIAPTLRDKSFKVLKRGGWLVSITGPVPPEEAAPYGAQAAFVSVRPSGGQLAEITKLIEDGRVKPFVERVYKLEDAARAHEQVDSGHTRGKIVLEIGGSHG